MPLADDGGRAKVLTGVGRWSTTEVRHDL